MSTQYCEAPNSARTEVINEGPTNLNKMFEVINKLSKTDQFMYVHFLAHCTGVTEDSSFIAQAKQL